MPSDKVHQWATGKSLISIDSLLSVCRSFEVPVLKFLTSNPSAVELSNVTGKQDPHHYKYKCPKKTIHTCEQKRRILQAALNVYPPPSIQEIAEQCGYAHYVALRRQQTMDLYNAVVTRHQNYQRTQQLEEQKLALKTALEGEEYPPLSMARVAKQIGKTVQTLYKNFPELCRAISERYNAYRKMAGAENRLLSQQQVWLIANELHNEGVKPTNSQISLRLANRVMINRKEILLAAKEARRRLGWE